MRVDLSKVATWLTEYQGLPDLFVVDMRLEDGGETLVLEADCDSNISSDQCGALSAYISEKLDAEGYDVALMVSSPGLTSPLRHIRQFQKNIGETVIVKAGNETPRFSPPFKRVPILRNTGCYNKVGKKIESHEELGFNPVVCRV